MRTTPISAGKDCASRVSSAQSDVFASTQRIVGSPSELAVMRQRYPDTVEVGGIGRREARADDQDLLQRRC